LNTQLKTVGLTAAVNQSGSLVIGGTASFALTGVTSAANAGGSGSLDATSLLATDASTAINKGDYNLSVTVAAAGTDNDEIISFSNGTVTKYVTLTSTENTAALAADKINAETSALGIYAIATNGSTGLSIQSSGSFTLTMVQQGDTGGTATGTFSTSGAQQIAVGQQATITGPDSTQSTTGNALAAITSISAAVAQLGKVQGRVGAGQNQLQYAINLAQSQIANFSSAESQIRDADVAAEAANLTKAQVLQQASMAAMAQANSAPQAVLALLRG
jgi:flagellin